MSDEILKLNPKADKTGETPSLRLINDVPDIDPDNTLEVWTREEDVSPPNGFPVPEEEKPAEENPAG